MQARMYADISGAMRLFHALDAIASPEMRGLLQHAVGKAAHRVEESMRKSLWDMVYSTPERDYSRTGRLIQGAHAAKPGTSHEADDETALSRDMHINDPTDVVGVTGLEFASEIGDWVSYAWFVHEGKGLGQRPPKPFSAQANLDAPFFLAEEVNSAIAAVLIAMAR